MTELLWCSGITCAQGPLPFDGGVGCDDCGDIGSGGVDDGGDGDGGDDGDGDSDDGGGSDDDGDGDSDVDGGSGTSEDEADGDEGDGVEGDGVEGDVDGEKAPKKKAKKSGISGASGPLAHYNMHNWYAFINQEDGTLRAKSSPTGGKGYAIPHALRDTEEKGFVTLS